jgi:maltose O-acetyltransferase
VTAPERLRWIPLAVASWRLVPIPLRRRLLRAAGVQLAPSAVWCSGIFVDKGNVRVGENAYVGVACHFEDPVPVTIGAGAFVASKCSFLTVTHAVGGPERRAGKLTYAPITVGTGTWVGSGTIVLAGVTIGGGCIIAAGSVVTSDCAANGLYAGAPAVRKREL